MTKRRAAIVAAAALVLLSCACAARRARPAVDGATFGVYRGRYTAPEGADVRFQAWIYAELPDRLHAEVLGPAGGAHGIVDGGNGRLAVTSIDEGVCYAGAATPDAVAAALGVKVSLAELVAAFLGDAQRAALPGLVREPEHPGLPSRFTLTSEGRVLALEKKSERVRAGSQAPLGTGEAPSGVEVRPLAELRSSPWQGAGARQPGAQ